MCSSDLPDNHTASCLSRVSALRLQAAELFLPARLAYHVPDMPRVTELDKRWNELMGLCRKEQEFIETGNHPKVTKFVAKAIDQLARELGFAERQIAEREFRAERDAGHIVRVITE